MILGACSPNPHTANQSGLEIVTTRPGSDQVDFDYILGIVEGEITKTLPGASFLGIVFSSPCRDLSKLRGTLVVTYVHTRWVPIKEEIFWGSSSVDTVRGEMELKYFDVSGTYPRTKSMPRVNHQQFQEMANLASAYIQKLNLPDCYVTITQMDEAWDVRCGKLADATQNCHFEVVNGQIRDLPKD